MNDDDRLFLATIFLMRFLEENERGDARRVCRVMKTAERIGWYDDEGLHAAYELGRRMRQIFLKAGVPLP